MTPEDIAAALALSDAATDGPWFWQGEFDDSPVMRTNGKTFTGYDGVERPEFVLSAVGVHTEGSVEIEPQDAEFIAAARTGWPQALRALQAVLALCAQAEVALARGCVCSADDWQVPVQHLSDRCGQPLGWTLDPATVLAAIQEAGRG